MEYGRMNIGSRPSKRKPSGGIESLRAIPWIFAWTQTRFHLPVWLGLGAALRHAIDTDSQNLAMLCRMYDQWPFFRVTIDLVEMVFAKGDPRIAALYDNLLVSEELRPLGDELRRKYEETRNLLLRVCAPKILLTFHRNLLGCSHEHWWSLICHTSSQTTKLVCSRLPNLF